jgi:hypothetical protein
MGNLAFLFRTSSGGPPPPPPPPPSGYVGFGAITQGHLSSPGQSFETYHVTSLADTNTQGTLRHALTSGTGQRLIVFDIGGTITLIGDLNFNKNYVTVDGLTAPDPGITISQGGFQTKLDGSITPIHDVIIRYMRNKGAGGQGSNNGDFWSLDGDVPGISKVILDHITAEASADGANDFNGNVSDITISNWLNLNTQLASNMNASTGLTTSTRRDRVTFYRNVWVHCGERMVRCRYKSSPVDYVNNIMCGWGWYEGIRAAFNIFYDSGISDIAFNVEDNEFILVSSAPFGTNAEKCFLIGDPSSPPQTFPSNPDWPKFYFNGNIIPVGETGMVSNTSRISIPTAAEVTHLLASQLRASLLPTVGTQYRTPAEQALVDQVAGA